MAAYVLTYLEHSRDGGGRGGGRGMMDETVMTRLILRTASMTRQALGFATL
jgi:hypothetical protein